jgi:hypothetical protein
MGGQLFTSLRETVGTRSVLGLKVPLGVDGDLMRRLSMTKVLDMLASPMISNRYRSTTSPRLAHRPIPSQLTFAHRP